MKRERVRVGRLVGALVLVPFLGCHPYGVESGDVPSPPVPPAADASSTDGGPGDAASSDAEASAPGAVSLVQVSFELSASVCAGIVVVRAVAQPDDMAATGQKACRICTTSEATAGRPGLAVVPYGTGQTIQAGLY